MIDILNFIAVKEDGDPGTTIRKAMSELHSQGLRPMEEGVYWNRGSSAAFVEIEPTTTSKPASVNIRRVDVPVKVFDADGNQIGEKTITKFEEKPLNVSTFEYSIAKSPHEKAFVRALAAFDTRRPYSTGQRSKSSIGYFRILYNAVMRAGLGEESAEYICELLEKTFGASMAFGNNTKVVDGIIQDIQRSNTPSEGYDKWKNFLESVEGQLTSPDAMIENMTDNMIHETAIILNIPDWHLKALQTRMIAERKGVPINHINSEEIDGDHDKVINHLEEVALERKIAARSNVRPRMRPLITSSNIVKPIRNITSEYFVPLFKVVYTNTIGQSVTKYHACTVRELKRKHKDLAGDHHKVHISHNRVRDLGFVPGWRKPIIQRVTRKVEDDNGNITYEPVSARKTCRGYRSTHSAYEIKCTCKTFRTHGVTLNLILTDCIKDITNMEIFALANTLDAKGTRFKNRYYDPSDKNSPKYMSAYAVKNEIANCSGREYTKFIEDELKDIPCPGCGNNSMTYHPKGFMTADGRWIAEQTVCIDLNPWVLEAKLNDRNEIVECNNERLKGHYAENVGDTWLVLKPDWLSSRPWVSNIIRKIREAPDLRKDAGAMIFRESFIHITDSRVRRILESALNTEIRRRLSQEIENSKFINNQFFSLIAKVNPGNFHAMSRGIYALLWHKERTSPEKTFGFAYMKALRDEFRSECLANLNESEDFTAIKNEIKGMGYVNIRYANKAVNNLGFNNVEKFILHEIVRWRRGCLKAYATPTDKVETMKEKLISHIISNNEAREILEAGRLTSNSEIIRLASAYLGVSANAATL